MRTIRILAHRGRDADVGVAVREAELDYYREQLARGFGVECDLRLTADREVVVSHLPVVGFGSAAALGSTLADLPYAEAARHAGPPGNLPRLCDILSLPGEGTIALHIDRESQIPRTLERIVDVLELSRALGHRLLAFGLRPAAAEFLRAALPWLSLAASLSDRSDIERFAAGSGETLLAVEEFVATKALYQWAWLDEWDLWSEHGEKRFYTAKVIAACRAVDVKIAVVSPELHSSRHRVSFEQHPDGSDPDRWEWAAAHILELDIDAIYTSRPGRWHTLIREWQAYRRMGGTGRNDTEAQRGPSIDELLGLKDD